MTKTQFKSEAPKAGIRPELYGVVLAGRLHSNCGYVCGGKVVGIEWLDGWKTERRYSCTIGEYEETFLSKVPYVILTKNKAKYRVEAWRVKAYVDNLFNKWLNEKIKGDKIL